MIRLIAPFKGQPVGTVLDVPADLAAWLVSRKYAVVYETPAPAPEPSPAAVAKPRAKK